MRRVHLLIPDPRRALTALGMAAGLAACGYEQEVVDFGGAAPSATRVPIQALLEEPVAPAPLPQTSRTSRGSALATHDGELFLVDRDNGDLVIMDQTSLGVLRRVHVGDRPEQVVVTAQGAAFVTVRGDDEVVRVDPGADQVAGRLAVGAAPWGIATSPDEALVYVSLSGKGTLVAAPIDLSAIAWQQPLGGTLRGVATDATGRVAVVDQHGPLRILVPGEGATTLRLGELRMWFPFELGGESHPGTATRSLAVVADPAAERFHVAHVIARPESGLPSDDGVSGVADPSVDLPIGEDNAYANSSESGAPPLRSGVTSIDANGGVLGSFVGGVSASMRGPATDMIDQPSDLVHHPSWSLLLMTGTGSDNVLVMSTQADQPLRGVIGLYGVGNAPRAIAIADDGQRAFVLEGGSFTVSELDLTPFLTPDFHPLLEISALPSSRQAAYGVDPLPPSLQAGRRLFEHVDDRIGASAGFACASCHFDGGEDKLAWPVDGMLRQTPMLAGRLADTAPYNWLGSEDTLVANIRRTIGRMGGTPEAFSDRELQDLADYLTGALVPTTNPNVGDILTAEQSLGKTLFESVDVGCSSCHSGGALTDGRPHFVGTSDVPLDTPSLRGLYETAPYFHDGSAATLRDVLDRPDSLMTRGADLSDLEKDALVAYLLTL